MTREELEQIYYLNRELRALEKLLEKLTAESLIQSPLPFSSHGSGVSDKVGKLAQQRVDTEQLIRDKKAEIQQQRDKALEYIYNIPDSLTRQVIYYRCVNLFSWKRVAYEVGGQNTEESVRKVYKRFFEKQEKLSVLSDSGVV